MNNHAHPYILRHDNLLRELMNHAEVPAPRIREAMIYSLFPGGKRLRPLLVYLCGELLDVPLASLDMIAAAVELTHCYSLIHDDLPAMDDDDLRRGKPSCHRAFDEATAILAGDGMQALAIDVLLSHLRLPPSRILAIAHELVKASGPAGMVSGQSLDLSELVKPSINEKELRHIHSLKTGKLILTCITMVLAASEPSVEASNALRQFATHLGLVFQMQDDYLDRYAPLDLLGKSRASDTANEKTTFATLYSQTELAALITHHFEETKNALHVFSTNANALKHFVDSLHQQIPSVE